MRFQKHSIQNAAGSLHSRGWNSANIWSHQTIIAAWQVDNGKVLATPIGEDEHVS
jgi:hypothetical protein